MELRAETLKEIDNFLEMFPSKYIRKSYLNGLKRFEVWYGDSITKLIGSKEATRTIEEYYVYLKENGVPQNSCRNLVNSVKQFLRFYETELSFRRDLGIYKTEKTSERHRLTINEVQCMASLSNLYEQVVLEVFLLGWRISDVVQLKKVDFDVLDQEAPIPIKIRASNEGTLYESFISQEFKELLKLYLPKVEGKWLFPGSEPGSHTKDKTLNRLLGTLVKRAEIKLHGSLTWHSGRRLVYSTGASLGIPEDIRKRLIGKSAPYSDDTYLEVDLKEPFLKIHNVLRLNPTKVNNRVGDVEKTVGILRETLTTLEKENVLLKIRIDNLQSNTMNLEDRLNEIGDFAAHTVEFGPYAEEEKEALRRKYNIREFSEEEKQLMRRKRAI